MLPERYIMNRISKYETFDFNPTESQEKFFFVTDGKLIINKLDSDDYFLPK